MNPNDQKQQPDGQHRHSPGQSNPRAGEEKRQAPAGSPDRDLGDDREPNQRREPDAEPQIPADKPTDTPTPRA